jgi:hypothetical protein
VAAAEVVVVGAVVVAAAVALAVEAADLPLAAEVGAVLRRLRVAVVVDSSEVRVAAVGDNLEAKAAVAANNSEVRAAVAVQAPASMAAAVRALAAQMGGAALVPASTVAAVATFVAMEADGSAGISADATGTITGSSRSRLRSARVRPRMVASAGGSSPISAHVALSSVPGDQLI